MALTGWIATHTGLPSLMAAGKEPIYVGDRLLTAPGFARAPRSTMWWKHSRAEERGPLLTEPRTTLVSDAFAVPGSTYTYTQGDSSVTLTRPKGEWWQAVISGMDGRVFPGVAWDDNGDPRDWKSGVHSFNDRTWRWPLNDPARTGTGVLTLLNGEQHERLWDLIRRSEPLIVLPGEHTVSLSPRFVIITKAASKRLYGDAVEYSCSWTEVPEDSPVLAGKTSGYGAAPVVNWGEWGNLDKDVWAHRTPIELCRQIAGMP